MIVVARDMARNNNPGDLSEESTNEATANTTSATLVAPSGDAFDAFTAVLSERERGGPPVTLDNSTFVCGGEVGRLD